MCKPRLDRDQLGNVVYTDKPRTPIAVHKSDTGTREVYANPVRLALPKP